MSQDIHDQTAPPEVGRVPRERIVSITVPTARGPEWTHAAAFGPFAVNLTGIIWEETDTGGEREHRLLCGVTHVATGRLVAQDMYDRGACFLAAQLMQDRALCAAFDTDDPQSVRARIDDEDWERLNTLVAVARRIGDD